MDKIRFIASPDRMSAQIVNVPGFNGDVFRVNFPESIGPSNNTPWMDVIKCSWQELDNGNWKGRGWVEGEMNYTIDMSIYDDYVDFLMRLTNDSANEWRETLTFNCVSCKEAITVRDHECKRHWVRSQGEFKRLIELPRTFGPRPAVQLYSIEGAPMGKDIPFVHGFQSTPDNVAIEGWIAIRARDGKHMVAVVSKPALFTFQNREYSCIHVSPTFGALKPGETGTALTRIYFVASTLEDWYQRMKEEFNAIDPVKL